MIVEFKIVSFGLILDIYSGIIFTTMPRRRQQLRLDEAGPRTTVNTTNIHPKVADFVYELKIEGFGNCTLTSEDSVKYYFGELAADGLRKQGVQFHPCKLVGRWRVSYGGKDEPVSLPYT